MTKISVIIPTLNEAEQITVLLQHIISNSNQSTIVEIIVVDGGSSDATQSIVSQIEACILLTSEKGRAKQMNLGAKYATGDVLYFLHADSFPPKDFDQYIIDEITKGNQAGCFRMQFDHSHWWLRLASWLTQFRWRACRGGDQSQFIAKPLFESLGGFDEKFIIYEDNDLINKLYAKNEFVVIQKKITTSARCYEKNGIWKLQYHFWAIYVKKWFGASAENLHQYYKQHVS
ncbi:glycosyl transferase family 2 [Flavobacteriales bacterium 34_180_T64]|nr:glycosyl transferase family 2 [Flavobacteriales bacterium 34_180_T64]